MKDPRRKSFAPLRGLPLQLYAITVLPLTVLLLLIAFGSVALHQNDMRALVGERDERAVQSAAAALESELHHRMAMISSMVVFAAESSDLPFERILGTSTDLLSDFDGGVAFLDEDGSPIASRGDRRLWDWISRNVHSVRLASTSDPGPVISDALPDPISQRTIVIISAYSSTLKVITAGAFTPELLAAQTLATSYPADTRVTIYLLDSSRRVLFSSGSSNAANLATDHPGVVEALRGESATRYVQVDNSEHVIAYSPIPSADWALITE